MQISDFFSSWLSRRRSRRMKTNTAPPAEILEDRTLLSAVQPQSAGYGTRFSGGIPGASDGWEFYSSNDGRIEVELLSNVVFRESCSGDDFGCHWLG